MAIDEKNELYATIDGRLLLGLKRLTCEPFRDPREMPGCIRRRIRGALSGAGMLAEHSVLERAALQNTTVEMHVFLEITEEHIISQGHICAVRLVWDGDDTICEFEFEGNTKLPI